MPAAGDAFTVIHDDGHGRDVVNARHNLAKERAEAAAQNIAREAATARLVDGANSASTEKVRLPVVVKAGSVGSLEALLSALTGPPFANMCDLDVVHSGLGDVSATELSIASTAHNCIILAYNVAVQPDARSNARSTGQQVHSSSVVYELLDIVSSVVRKRANLVNSGEAVGGRLLVKRVFSIGKGGKVAGCELQEGLILSASKVRVVRNRLPVYVGSVLSLKVGKQGVDRVTGAGAECGLSLDGFVDFEAGDVIESLGGDNVS
jgi:translation initiation factor IF-2